MSSLIDLVVVGLGFGEDFLPIYMDHPDVGEVAVVEPDEERRESVADRHGIEHRYERIEEVLEEPGWDAVHVLSPVRFHADHSIAVLESGKHCACAVPMATELSQIEAVIEAQQQSQKNYMMMETSAYTREFLTTQALNQEGRLGEITLYRGFHIQNLDGFPSYWQGYPPMKYITHALSPALALTDSAVTTVRAVGSSRLAKHQTTGGFDNPYPTEVGLFELSGTDAVAEVTMSFFRIARSYVEGYHVYGDQMSLEWPAIEDGPLMGFRVEPYQEPQEGRRIDHASRRGRPAEEMDVTTDDFRERLPEPIRRYTRDYSFTPADGQEPIARLAEHGGSHPHLVHEFISSIVEDRQPTINAVMSARWTAPGIVAHQSALAGGEARQVPSYGTD